MENKINYDLLKTYKELNEEKQKLDKQLKSLKDEIIKLIPAEIEYVSNDLKVIWREIISNRFDSTKFKKENIDLYNSYLKESKSIRLDIKRLQEKELPKGVL